MSMRVLFFATVLCLLSCQKEPSKVVTQPVKNIIFLIGDGTGVAQMYAGMSLSPKPLAIEKSQYIGLIKTYSSDNYITDSAAGATAFSIGRKTYNGAIGVDSQKKPHKTILEMAEEKGLATGLVASSVITHATPASFIAHQPERSMHEEIAADFLKTDIDIFIGGGEQYFNQRKDSLNLLDSLQAKGYTVCSTLEQVKQSTSAKIAGLLAPKHLPAAHKGRGDLIAQATKKALNVLSQNENGFFLMVEGSQIDWGGHANDIEYITEEVMDFNKVIEVAFSFAQNDPNTLVVITADHETGGLTLLGKDAQSDTLKVNFSTGKHSGVMVPVYAFGKAAKDFSGIYENTQIFDKMIGAYGW